MLKIVPDPPLDGTTTPQTLEELLVQSSDYLVCALTVARQSALMHTRQPGQIMAMTAMHEIENARNLLETAISRLHSHH